MTYAQESGLSRVRNSKVEGRTLKRASWGLGGAGAGNGTLRGRKRHDIRPLQRYPVVLPTRPLLTPFTAGHHLCFQCIRRVRQLAAALHGSPLLAVASYPLTRPFKATLPALGCPSSSSPGGAPAGTKGKKPPNRLLLPVLVLAYIHLHIHFSMYGGIGAAAHLHGQMI